MSFVKRVQHKAVSRPNQRSFDPRRWRAEFDAHHADAADQSLLQAGVWFHQAFEALRRQLGFAADQHIGRQHKLLAFITHANLNAMLYDEATREIRDRLTNADAAERAWQQVVPKLSDNQGIEHVIDEVAQADIDGLHLPIQMVLAGPADAEDLDITTTHWDLKRVERDYQLGALYGVLERHWEDCLWNDYRIDITDKVVLSPGNPHFAAWKVISQFRRNILVQSKTNTHMLHFQKHRAGRTHTELAIPRTVRAITTQHGITRYPLVDEAGVDDAAAFTYVIIHEAMEPYYTGYSAFQAPRLHGATIHHVINCWAVLRSLARCLMDTPTVPPQTPLGDALLVHVAAPRVDKTALRNAVAEALGVTLTVSQALIEFLTFDPADKSDTGKNELWTQPLIPYNDDTLLMLFTPLLWGTTQRNVNIWLRQMGADLGARGNSFETHVRQTLAQFAQGSRLNKHLRILPHAFKFNLAKGVEPPYEDIDLLLLIGTTLLVGEVKCFLQPADTLSTFQHRDKVIDACAQVARKIERIRQHEKSFRKQCLKANVRLPDKFVIQPLVVLNGPAHCGLPYNGIPIVDIFILRTFLTGMVRQHITENVHGVIAEQQTLLYTDLKSAEANLATYLCAPPQLAYIKDALTEQESSPKQIAENIEQICYRHFEVVL